MSRESAPYRVYAWIYGVIGMLGGFLAAAGFDGDLDEATITAFVAISLALLIGSAILVCAARKIDDLQADCQELEDIIKTFDDETNTEIVVYTLPGEDAQ